jgi:uncharacterized protein
MNLSKIVRATGVCMVAVALAIVRPSADTTAQTLPFAESWAPGLITANDNWSGVPGIVGYLGESMASATGVDPQTILIPGPQTLDANANQANPNTFTTGGVTEFELADTVVALSGSGTARAPHIVLTLVTTGLSNITVQYNLRDLDGSIDNAISPVALQFRAGSSGNYTNVPAGFVADATTGPSQATLVTPVSATLPAAASNQPLIQVRVMTTDAAGNDEWVGIDDISVTGLLVPEPTNPTGIGSASPSTVAVGEQTLLTVAVSPGQNPLSTGIGVSANLSAIGGAMSQPFLDDGMNGDGTAGDGTFSFIASIPPGTATGSKVLPATVSDAEGRSSVANIGLDVFVPVTAIVISQVYGGGGNSGAPYRNDFIELYNRSSSPVDITGWSVQYASANGTSWQTTPLAGVMQPGTYYLVAEAAGTNVSAPPLPTPDATGTIAMSGASGKVALAISSAALTGACPAGGTVADKVGYGSTACFEGTGPAPELSNTTAAIRAGGGAIDTNDNAADFIEGAPSPHSSQGQPPTGTGTSAPALLDSGDSSLLTVTVTAGSLPPSTNLSVTADLQQIGGIATQPFFDDGTNGDVTAGDSVFSYLTTVTGTSGTKNITAVVSDAQGRSTTTVFSVTIQPPPIPINAVQGGGSRSVFEGQVITTIGVVTALRSSSFYIETPDGEQDADVNTSEGLLIFTGFPRPALIARGDLVKVAGRVVEFVPSADPDSPPLTELGGTVAISVLSSGNPLPAPVSLLPSYTSPSGDFEQLERFEGMRVVANMQAISGTDSFAILPADEENATSRSNGDFFAVIQGVARPMRERGIEQSSSVAAPPSVPRWDENPERMRVDSNGQEGAASIEIVAGQTISGLTGVLDYGFRSYTIVPDPQPWIPAGDGSARPVPVANANEFTVASFNMERFFDEADDPAKDEAVLTPAAVEKRMSKASLAIRNVLRLPDVIGVEEVENLSILERLADRVNADAVAAGQADPHYVAYLEEGNDIGGIDVGFLVKESRVEVKTENGVKLVTQIGKTATFTEPNGQTALLNDRPSLVLEALVHGAAGYPLMQPYPVTIVVNHLRSLSGIAGSDGARIRTKRQKQAEFLANYLQSRQAANPDERIVSVGDYNAFQVNDGYVDVIGTILGRPTPPAEVLVASPDLVNPDFINVGDALGSEQYSFVFDGSAQTLDHVIVNQRLHSRLARMAYARNDADFPESFRSDGTRPERLSDHDMPTAFFALPGAPVVTLTGDAVMTVECRGTFVDPGATATDEEFGPLPVAVSGTVDTTACGSYTLTYSATNSFTSASVTRTVNVVDTTPPVLTLSGAAAITVEAGSTWTDPGTSATDTCAGNLSAAIQISGTVNTSAPGTYPITYSVSDGFNSATVTRHVTVVDTTAPEVGPVLALPPLLWPANHTMWDVLVLYLATDVTGTPRCSLSVTSNEPLNGPGDGNTNVDWQVIGPYHVRLRAERAVQGTGRIYTITVSCTDSSGNVGTGNARVFVPR